MTETDLRVRARVGGVQMWHGVTVRGIAVGKPKSFKAWIVEPERAESGVTAVREFHALVCELRDKYGGGYLLSQVLLKGGLNELSKQKFDRGTREAARIVWEAEAPVWMVKDVRLARDQNLD